MGLDMYLYKRTYIWDKDKKKTLRINVPGVDSKRVEEISEEVAYWRKANAIHKWFVDNVQEGVDNCATYYVRPEKLLLLLETVREVIKHPEKGPELLPTQSGFFFGDTEYDENYKQDLVDTERQLTEVLKEYEKLDKPNSISSISFAYQSSW